MSKPEYNNVGKLIFEFRYDPIISFFDWKGELTQHLLDEFKLDAFRVTNNKIEITKADTLNYIAFVSPQNAGFSIENINDFEKAKKEISAFLKALKAFNKYRLKKVIRLGVRWNLLQHKRNSTYDQVKRAFDESIIKLDKDIYTTSSDTITDVGLPINLRGKDYDIKIMHGPMEQNQAAIEFFMNRQVYFEGDKPGQIIPKHGLFIDIDVYTINLGEISIDDVEKTALKYLEIGKKKSDHIFNEFFKKIA